MSASVCVIIAAYNAEATLLRAIGSALAEAETAEVIVVDDASTDQTSVIAHTAAARDGRVKLITMKTNKGPGAARNAALEMAQAPFVAVLDSDDIFLPGRLRQLIACGEGEIIADNIAFVTAHTLGALDGQDWSGLPTAFEPLDAAQFVQGNLHQPGVARGELGFLKPLLSRAFLEQHGLRYDPALRLGEDYDLYVRMLLAGARMHLTRRPGYGAMVRDGSLSASHEASDLAHLHGALDEHLRYDGVSGELQRAMRAHLRQVRDKRDHRIFLDLRRAKGAWAALRYALHSPRRFWTIGARILRDKLKLSTTDNDAVPASGVRLLLPAKQMASALR